VAFLAVWLESGLKREAIEGAFDRRHAARRELRTRVLWQNKKAPGAGLGALGRPAEFRFETDLGSGLCISSLPGWRQAYTESELQGPPEAAPKASPSFSVSEKLARYGSAALSSVEHLTLLVGAESIAKALIRHFGSLKALSRASFLELRQLLPQQKAEAVMAALSMSAIVESEQALSNQLDNPPGYFSFKEAGLI